MNSTNLMIKFEIRLIHLIAILQIKSSKKFKIKTEFKC